MTLTLDWFRIKQNVTNPFVKSTYMWVFIVPLAAKVTERIKEILHFKFFSEDIIIQFQLPFQWYYFYFSAVLFLICFLSFKLFSPKIVVDLNDYGEYVAKNMQVSNLNEYKRQLDKTTTFPLSYPSIDKEFWRVWDTAIKTNFLLRSLITILIYLGYFLFGIVLLQNMAFIVHLIIQ